MAIFTIRNSKVYHEVRKPWMSMGIAAHCGLIFSQEDDEYFENGYPKGKRVCKVCRKSIVAKKDG